MASEGLHEDIAKLNDQVLDQHRAISSLMEEMEAVDWYGQRVAATNDATLKSILTHNRDEEKEHAAMVLEWIRRNDPVMDQHLRDFLFTEGPIQDKPAAAVTAESGSLGIGSLRRAVKS